MRLIKRGWRKKDRVFCFNVKQNEERERERERGRGSEIERGEER